MGLVKNRAPDSLLFVAVVTLGLVGLARTLEAPEPSVNRLIGQSWVADHFPGR